jgi:hypothetical protein
VELMADTSSPTPEPIRPEVVAGLVREVDALRKAVRKVAGLQGQVEQLAATLAQVLDEFAATGRAADPARPVSWIGETADPDAATRALRELADWVGRVYLRYPIAARELPDCWLWHPDMVEELAWLHQAWQAAYSPDTGTVGAAADWHDRYRPGVVARIRTANFNSCSLENHLAPDRPTGAVTVPGAGSVEGVALWWSTGRDRAQPPLPTQADLDAADRRLREGRR